MPKNIVVLGGGFGGLRAALNLEGLAKGGDEYRVILIDQNTFHLYTASLYEIAVGELSSKCILLPFHKILKNKSIKFLNSGVTNLDPEKRIIKTDDGDEIPYWKLVLALGSDTEDFGITGVSKHAINFKSTADAEEVYRQLAKCAVEEDKPARVVIGGGGFTGVEVAGELPEYKRCPVEVAVIEAAPTLLPGLPDKISKSVSRRLNFLGVKIITSSPIQKVEKENVVFKGGRKVPYDVLIWTAGVRGSRFLDPKVFPLDKKKALKVDKHLRVEGFEDIYAVGDIASTGVAWTATKAEEDGKVAAANIKAEAKGKSLKEYKEFEPPFIIPVGGRWAVAKVGSLIFSGKLASILKDFVLLYYLLTILPPWSAVKTWWGGEREVLKLKSPSTLA